MSNKYKVYLEDIKNSIHNIKIIWDIIMNKLPRLKETVNEIIKNADIDKDGD